MNKEEITELENPYFDVLAEMGITKHAGGLSATIELLELGKVAGKRRTPGYSLKTPQGEENGTVYK